MTNPMIVGERDPQPFAGVRVMSGGYNAYTDIKAGLDGEGWNGIALGIDGALIALDFLSVVANPLKGLMVSGIGWLLDHVEFLQETIHFFTGDPYEVTALAATWTQLSVELNQAADEYEQVTAGLTGWNGQAADGYMTVAGEFQVSLRGAAAWSQEVSRGIAMTGVVVATIKDLVVKLISDFVTQVIMVVVPAVASATVTFGASLASAMGWFWARLASVMASIGKQIAKLMKVCGKLAGRFGKMGGAIQKAGTKMGNASKDLAIRSKNLADNASLRQMDLKLRGEGWKQGGHNRVDAFKTGWQNKVSTGNPWVAKPAPGQPPNHSWDNLVRGAGNYPNSAGKGAMKGIRDGMASQKEGDPTKLDPNKDESP
ncbi:hypothetical protein Afil01_15920 [Actinorhabdospora filicis]|uniref:PPE domain-containing protein n=1 Tax=Actinorhabdospora filicis TaxID=1785913 RepID=A0A9W6SIW5_9ACTN|nr:PPE domain-containing protein [Actinorhabdospora filicis]GLZ76785.1 hypothetical protein Afil01_15920 [Actinorhabdospora filicis]